ncbi:DENN domain-containing protein 2A [Pteropus alecto]|uniref:DENN domain-containing protein 2A n=1 Tax=Pteropus alecto TaxID=9402 RepID=L5KSK6_PTEAL|nr:DENN domain-containing protein 2A [Pteropus alecto]
MCFCPPHHSETFSFVLTGEDGSRRFGYCRRLLPGGKGKRLPEVYCIVSRLGCFSLFSKILDEVEKRRGISPALVQPLMRSVMEAPFPALGKTIVVRNFLPGSGTEMDDEDSILPRKLQVALEHILEHRNDLAGDQDEGPPDCKHGPESSPLNEVVSEAFVRFFVETVGHYSLFLAGEREERTLQREAFRKAVSSKSLRRFLEVFMETQMFRGFAQERELRRQDARGLFEVRAQEYLETLPSGEHSGVNRFLKGLGNKMKFLHKK